jgi:predicted amidohydrolase
MPLEHVILKSTWIPARVLGRERQIGTLGVGANADLFAFALEDGEFPLEDTHLKIETAKRRIKPLFAIKGGEFVKFCPHFDKVRKLRECDLALLRSVEQSA